MSSKIVESWLREQLANKPKNRELIFRRGHYKGFSKRAIISASGQIGVRVVKGTSSWQYDSEIEDAMVWLRQKLPNVEAVESQPIIDEAIAIGYRKRAINRAAYALGARWSTYAGKSWWIFKTKK